MSPEAAPAWETRESLKDVLRSDPASWLEVVDLLASGDNLELGLRIVRMIRISIDDRAEALLIDLLRTRSDGGVGRICVAALAGRTSPASTDALAQAAAQNPHAAVRLAALYALAGQKDQTLSDSARIERIADFLRERAQAETSSEVRNTARVLSGASASGEAASPPPPAFRKKASIQVDFSAQAKPISAGSP